MSRLLSKVSSNLVSATNRNYSKSLSNSTRLGLTSSSLSNFNQHQQIRTKTSTATALWSGPIDLPGAGTLSTGSKAVSGLAYTKPSRFTDDDNVKTNPEELIGAALSGCWSMFVSSLLTKKGLNPDAINTTATVTIADGAIQKIAMVNETKCSGIDQAGLEEVAKAAKEACPVGKALSGVGEITLDVKLV